MEEAWVEPDGQVNEIAVFEEPEDLISKAMMESGLMVTFPKENNTNIY
jgi:hypothetical protein